MVKPVCSNNRLIISKISFSENLGNLQHIFLAGVIVSERHVLKGHTGSVMQCSFSNNGKLLASWYVGFWQVQLSFRTGYKQKAMTIL